MSYKEPTYSIIIPVYNGETCVAKAIDSCLNQSYKDLEIIVINDRSTDNTYFILEEYAQKGLIKVLHNEENLGPLASRTKGALTAKGEYLLFLDADDTLYEEACHVFKTIDKPVDLIIYPILDHKKEGDYIYTDYSECMNHKGSLLDMYMTHPKRLAWTIAGKVYRRLIIVQACADMETLFHEPLYLGEDSLLYLGALRYVHSYSIINHPLYHYYSHTEEKKPFISRQSHLDTQRTIKKELLQHYNTLAHYHPKDIAHKVQAHGEDYMERAKNLFSYNLKKGLWEDEYHEKKRSRLSFLYKTYSLYIKIFGFSALLKKVTSKIIKPS